MLLLRNLSYSHNVEAVYMHGDLCSVRNGSCVYAWRLVFSEEWKLCIYAWRLVFSEEWKLCIYAWRLVFSEEWKLCICMETCSVRN